MPRTKFRVEVLTPEGEVFNEEVEMISTKTTVGSIGVLANHAPLLAMLDPTELRLYRSDSEIVRFAQAEGYMVYAIGFHSRCRCGSNGGMIETDPDPSLKKIAAESGGGYFELKEGMDLSSTFTRVADAAVHASGFSLLCSCSCSRGGARKRRTEPELEPRTQNPEPNLSTNREERTRKRELPLLQDRCGDLDRRSLHGVGTEGGPLHCTARWAACRCVDASHHDVEAARSGRGDASDEG